MKALIKKIYHHIPFKKQIFSCLKMVYTPDESIYRHLYFDDVMTVRVNKDSKFKIRHYGFQIENEIFWKGLEGGWEKTSVNLWVQLSRNANTIIDIGANTGIFALIAKAVNSDASIYAFEPIERVYEKLEENIVLNNYNIRSYPLAISNINGQAYIYDDPGSANNYSVTVNKNLSPTTEGLIKVDIDIITLDSFIDDNRITGIDLLKIDVETHEGEVMEGFMKHLPLFKPTFLIEILRNEVGEKVQSCIQGLGYLYYNINENGDIDKVDDILRRGHNYNYLLCQPDIATQLGLAI